MTDTDTTTQAGSQTAGQATEAAALAVAKTAGTDASAEVNAAETKVEGALDTAKTDVAGDVAKVEAKVETAVDAVKADVTSDASGVEKALSADAGTIDTDVKSDIETAKAHAQAALTHIESAGFISDELTKAKRLLEVVVAYIEKHL
jgi:hypothetical protein